MSSLQIISHPQVGQWVMDRLPGEGFSSIADVGPFVAFGVVRDGRPLCGVVYNWYREMEHGNDMRVIIVSENPGWCLPGILRELFRYPFEMAGCERLTAIIKEGNEESIRLCKGLGFRKEGVLRRGYNGKTNALIFGMLKSDCKWLHRSRKIRVSHYGQEKQLSASATRSGKNNRGANGSQPSIGH